MIRQTQYHLRRQTHRQTHILRHCYHTSLIILVNDTVKYALNFSNFFFILHLYTLTYLYLTLFSDLFSFIDCRPNFIFALWLKDPNKIYILIVINRNEQPIDESITITSVICTSIVWPKIIPNIWRMSHLLKLAFCVSLFFVVFILSVTYECPVPMNGIAWLALHQWQNLLKNREISFVNPEWRIFSYSSSYNTCFGCIIYIISYTWMCNSFKFGIGF